MKVTHARANADGEARLRGMPWLSNPKSGLSKKIAEELNQGEHGTFNRTVEAAVRNGMRPLDASDIGLFASGLIVNVPVRDGAEVVKKHNPIMANLGCWNYAASLLEPEGSHKFSGREKANIGRLLILYLDAIRSRAEIEDGFWSALAGNLVSTQRAQAAFRDDALCGEYRGLNLASTEEIKRTIGEDKTVLTKDAYEVLEKTGLVMDKKYDVAMRATEMRNTTQMIVNLVQDSLSAGN